MAQCESKIHKLLKKYLTALRYNVYGFLKTYFALKNIKLIITIH